MPRQTLLLRRLLARRPAPALVAPLLASLALSTAFIVRFLFRVDGVLHAVLFDDAMISMRYARNLAEGHGLVWNPGGPAVEGYTNFLWTLWMALLHRSGTPDAMMSALVSASGAIILALHVPVVRAIAIRLAPETPAVGTLAAWLVALCLPLTYWTLLGLEVGLLSLLTVLSVLLALRLGQTPRRRDPIVLAAVLAAAVLVRTDQLVLAAVIVAFVGLRAPRDLRVLGVLTPGLVVAATVAAHTVFRLAYYGDPLPNAYYLKLGGVALGARLVRGVGALGVVGLETLFVPCALALVAIWRADRDARRDVALPLAVFLGQCAYSVAVGGDAWEWDPVPNRFLTAGLPALLLTSALGAWRLSTLETDRRRRLVVAATIGLAVAAAVMYVARATLRGGRGGGDGDASTWGPGGVRWWALVLVVTLLLCLAAALGRRGAGDAGRLVACGLVLLVAANAVPGSRLLRLAIHARGGGTYGIQTRLAVALRETTAPDASVAVVWAGTIPYFSRRPAVDLLGRSDRQIARMAPRTSRFWPGHTKWDYDHSIGRLRPDVIAQLFRPTGAELAAIQRWGYEALLPDVLVRSDSVAVDRAALTAALCRSRPRPCPATR